MVRKEDTELLNLLVEEKIRQFGIDDPFQITNLKRRITNVWKRLRRIGFEPDEAYSVIRSYWSPDLETFEEFIRVLRTHLEAGEELPPIVHDLLEKYSAMSEKELRIWRKSGEIIQKEYDQLSEAILNLMNKYNLPESLAYAVAVGDIDLFDALAQAGRVSLCDVIYDTKLIQPIKISDVTSRELPESLIRDILDIASGVRENCLGEKVTLNEVLQIVRKRTKIPDYVIELVENPTELNLDGWNMFSIDVQDLLLGRDKAYVAIGDTCLDLASIKSISLLLLGLDTTVLSYVNVIMREGEEYAYVTIPVDSTFTVWRISTINRDGIFNEEKIEDLIFRPRPPPKKITKAVTKEEISEEKPPTKPMLRRAILPPIEEVKKQLEENLGLEVINIEPMSLPSFGYVYVATVIDESDKGLVRIILGQPKAMRGEYLWAVITNKRGERLMVYVLNEDVIRMTGLAEAIKVLPPEEISGVIIPEDKKGEIVSELENLVAIIKQLDEQVAIKRFDDAYVTLLLVRDKLNDLLDKLAELSYKLEEINKRRVGKLAKVQVKFPELWEWFSSELRKHGVDPEQYRENYNAIIELVGGAGREFIKKELRNEIKRILAEEELKTKTMERVFRRMRLPKPARLLRMGIASLYINVKRALTSAKTSDAEGAFLNLLRAWSDTLKLINVLESIRKR